MFKYYFAWFFLAAEALAAVAFGVRGFQLLQAAAWYPAAGCLLAAVALLCLLAWDTHRFTKFPEGSQGKGMPSR